MEKRKSIFIIVGLILIIVAIMVCFTPAKISKMMNEHDYKSAIELFNETKYIEAKELFQSLEDYKDSNKYIDECGKKIKYCKFDYSGADFFDFYNYYGEMSDISNIADIEANLSFIYGTWYDDNDAKIEISETLFDGKEYGVYALGNRAALIYFCEDSEDSSTYELYSGQDHIAGDLLYFSKSNNREDSTCYRHMTSFEYEEAYRTWEEQQPQYVDSVIIDKTTAEVWERIESIYPWYERFYHGGLNVIDSYVVYEWTTKTYTCYMSIEYTTNTPKTYTVVGTYKDIGNELVKVGFTLG